jgi:glycogen debranching enzyme
MADIIQLENKYYIAVNSSYTDNRMKVLNHVDSFGIFDRWGDVKLLGEEVQGIYHRGMRYVSELELRINGKRPLLLSSSVKDENEILSVDLTNPVLHQDEYTIPRDVLHIGRTKFIRDGSCFEQVNISNFGSEPYEFCITLSINADFKDIFEIRGMKREKRGEISEIRHLQEGGIRICYSGLDGIMRHTVLNFSKIPDEWDGYNKAVFKVRVQPHDEQVIEYALHFLTGDEKPGTVSFTDAKKRLHEDLRHSSHLVARIKTSSDQFNEWINRSQNDLLSLLAKTKWGRYPYAGVPWYNTAFGRDGIITALETLWVAPSIAKDTLNYLAKTQAASLEEFRDAEPGKIIHEVRGGEMAELNEIPFKQYYGSVDSTPLFVMLAAAYYRRTADIDFIKTIWPNIIAGLNWIDEYGDIDGDGFVEYQHKSKTGLTNQGWKDSHDSIMHEDGQLAPTPIALCEVQAYVYEAKKGAAQLATLMGDTSLAEKLQQEAAHLKNEFNRKFWDEELGFYVLALDGNKKPCRVITSNAGHCLFTSIADGDKAERVAERLMQPDMFSGWGIRTLSKKEKCYNPMSYHNGSVWPHDVALIARGLSKYGFVNEAVKLTGSLYDAASFIEMHRLPELFCGFDRRKGEGPTNYPVACSPQAWSVAATYIMLEACLHLEIDAENRKVWLHKPMLPEGVNNIEVRGLQLNGGLADIKVFCENGIVSLKVKTCPQDWQIALTEEEERVFQEKR